jgi:hypothetical protein
MNITKKPVKTGKNCFLLINWILPKIHSPSAFDTSIRCRVFVLSLISFLSLAALPMAAGKSVAKKEEADTSKIVVPDEYWKDPAKKPPLFDSTGRQLSARQMVNYIKSEYIKLNQEITELNSKMFPDSASASTTDDADVEHLFILKGKIEYLEKSLDEWNKRIDIETNTGKKDSIPSRKAFPDTTSRSK